MLGGKAKNYAATPVLEDLRSFDGAALGHDWLDAAIARGLGWIVNIGAFSTPITGGGNGTILDLDQPEGIISVPAGITIRPIRVHLHGQTPLLATDADESELLIAVDRTAKWAVDGTYTLETPYNLRTDFTEACPCQAASAFTADTTDPVLDIELARSVIVGDVQGTPATALWTKNELLYEPKTPPFIVGPAMLVVYWGGTVATTGFAEICFVAFPSSKISGLHS